MTMYVLSFRDRHDRPWLALISCSRRAPRRVSVTVMLGEVGGGDLALVPLDESGLPATISADGEVEVVGSGPWTNVRRGRRLAELAATDDEVLSFVGSVDRAAGVDACLTASERTPDDGLSSCVFILRLGRPTSWLTLLARILELPWSAGEDPDQIRARQQVALGEWLASRFSHDLQELKNVAHFLHPDGKGFFDPLGRYEPVVAEILQFLDDLAEQHEASETKGGEP